MKKLACILMCMAIVSGFMPRPALAQIKIASNDYGHIIPCGFDKDLDKKISNEEQCHFDDVVKLFSNVMNELIKFSTILFVFSMIYVGFQMMVNQGNVNGLTELKKRLLGFIKGYAAILLAWVVVYTISNALLKTGFTFIKN